MWILTDGEKNVLIREIHDGTMCEVQARRELGVFLAARASWTSHILTGRDWNSQIMHVQLKKEKK